jgi:hypothetical protein
MQMPTLTLPQSAPIAPVAAHLVPATIADAGEQAGWRYLEFFTANLRNPHTRRAYARACARFFAWCADHGLTLPAIRPFNVACWSPARCCPPTPPPPCAARATW